MRRSTACAFAKRIGESPFIRKLINKPRTQCSSPLQRMVAHGANSNTCAINGPELYASASSTAGPVSDGDLAGRMGVWLIRRTAARATPFHGSARARGPGLASRSPS